MAIDVTVQDAADGIDTTVSGGVDTRTNVSDDGTQVVADVTDLNMAGGDFDVTNPTGSDVDITLTDDTLDEGTVTATGGSTPAADTVVTTTLDQTDPYHFTMYVDSDPAFDADYAWNYDFSHEWDDASETVTLDVTVNWDTDPGAGNDVTLHWEAIGL